jgi:hypothetical protein
MGLFPAFTYLFHNPNGALFSSRGYRDQFASKVLTFLQKMHARGVDLEDIIIWNEPNNDPPPPDPPNPGYMTSQNFSLLMYRCWKTIFDSVASTGFMPRLYWGGLFSKANEHYPSTYQYAAAVYAALNASGLMNSEPVAYPWTGINIHMHRLRTADRAWDLLKKTREVQRTRGDDGSLIVGEWGVTEEDGPNQLSELYANILQTAISPTNRAQPDIMFFYKHHRDPESGEDLGIQKYSVQTTAGVDNYELEANDSATQSLIPIAVGRVAIAARHQE